RAEGSGRPLPSEQMMSMSRNAPEEDDAVLVIAAVDLELRPFRELIDGAISGLPRIELLETGVGKAPCAARLAKAVALRRPSRILAIGVGGGFRPRGLEVGDVAIATREVFADDGVETDEGFLGLERLGLPSVVRGDERLFEIVPVTAPPRETIDAIAKEHADAFRIGSGTFVTVSTGSGSTRREVELETRFAPICESMEGAAAALVAWEERIPFTEIRGLSNFVGP